MVLAVVPPICLHFEKEERARKELWQAMASLSDSMFHPL
jgi:hypothetical protein